MMMNNEEERKMFVSNKCRSHQVIDHYRVLMTDSNIISQILIDIDRQQMSVRSTKHNSRRMKKLSLSVSRKKSKSVD